MISLNVIAKQFSLDLLNQKDAQDLHVYTNHNPNRLRLIDFYLLLDMFKANVEYEQNHRQD